MYVKGVEVHAVKATQQSFHSIINSQLQNLGRRRNQKVTNARGVNILSKFDIQRTVHRDIFL